MDLQETAQVVAPWLAITTGLIAIITAIMKSRSTDRLRSALQRDIELHGAMPDGAGKTSLSELLDFEGDRLRERVQHGRRFGGGQLLLLMGAYLLLFHVSLRALRYAESQGWVDDNRGRLEDISEPVVGFGIMLFWAVGVGLIITGSAVLVGKWLRRKLDHGMPGWRERMDDALSGDRMTRWIVPKTRRPASDARRAEAEADDSAAKAKG
ncbi:hypothetical protein [Nocardioides sp. SR21]|uniref:hypothetical protein n=1 Tax=Nocardioides sp. SR21 TaxID=2919501 RepID=UPI001FAB05E7|nr:hypothetical protein [Nocardioides sp. SR21]